MSAEEAADLDAVERIFAEAVELPPEARPAHIERACADAPALRDRVLRLLEADAAGATLDLPSPTVWLPIDSHAAGDVIGRRYRLVRVIGTGGLGVVWMAEQFAPVERSVALKFIRHDLDGRQIARRFALERTALSLMDHPGIARIHDAGCEADGRPYFAMELVDGEPITIHCDATQMAIADRVSLMADVCLAVHHAHQKGIVHRDLKPSNILVVRVDGRSLPKIIDFGIAKAMAWDEAPRLAANTTITRIGQVVGTPAYMAPEQLAGDGSGVDVRSDIFALGVVLHELLAGCLPHDRSSAQVGNPVRPAAGAAGAGARPPSSSVRRLSAQDVAAVAERRRETPRSLRRRLRGELDWIVAKAIAGEPPRRYASASELAADLHRWLRREPIAAGPPGAAYQMRKFVERHTAAVAAALLVTVSLSLGLVGTTLGLHRAKAAEQRQRELSELAEAAAARAALNSYKAQIAAVDAALASHDTATARRILAAADPAMRGWEWSYLHRLSDQADLVVEVGGGEAWAAAFTPDGAEILITSKDGTLRSFDASTGAPLRRIDLAFGSVRAFWLDISEDGDRVWVGGSAPVTEPRFEYRLLEWPGGRIVSGGFGRARGSVFSPDGAMFAIADERAPLIRLLDSADGSIVRSLDLPDDVHSVWAGFGVDGRLVGFWNESQGIAGTVDPTSGSVRRWNVPVLAEAIFEPSSGRYHGGDDRGNLVVTTVDDPGRRRVLRDRSPRGFLGTVQISPDGALAVGSSWFGGTLQLHGLPDDRPIALLHGHLDRVIGADFSADGRALVTASADGTVRVWRLPPAGDRFSAPLTDPSARLGGAITGDGSLVASGGWGQVQLWRSDTGSLEWSRDMGARYVELLAFSPDEDRLAAAETNGRVLVLRAADGAIERTLPATGTEHTALAWDPLNRWLVVGCADGSMRLHGASTGSEDAALQLFDGPVTALAISRDGRLFVTGAGAPLVARDNWARIVAAPPGEAELVVGRLDDRTILARIPLALGPSAACFDPEGGRVFVGRNDGAVLAFDVDSVVGAPDQADAQSRAVRCVPASDAATAMDASGRPAASLHQVSSLAFTPDGTRLLVGQRSGALRIAMPGEDGLLLRLGTDTSVHATTTTADGATLVVACRTPFVALESELPPADLVVARERVRLVRAMVDPVVEEERILERVLARIDATTDDPSLRADARRYAMSRGEYHALMVSQAVERARDPALGRAAHQAALDWIEHVRAHRERDGAGPDGAWDLIVAALCLRVGHPRRAATLLESSLADGGGADAIADMAVPAVLAMTRLALGERERAAALMEAVERRVGAGERLRGEALWYVPEARRAIAVGR